MEKQLKKSIQVKTTVNTSLEKVWTAWNDLVGITRWYSGSPDWHTPWAVNDFRTGGRFVYRMESKDGKTGFDFGGTYTKINPMQEIRYTMDDGRKVIVEFSASAGKATVSETFEAEEINSIEKQRAGWQAILDNFKNYTEKNAPS